MREHVCVCVCMCMHKCVCVCVCARINVFVRVCDRVCIPTSLYSHERNTKSIEGLLALANTFFTVSGANTRRRVCALGEPLLNGLTGMWSRCQPAVRVRREERGEGRNEENSEICTYFKGQREKAVWCDFNVVSCLSLNYYRESC